MTGGAFIDYIVRHLKQFIYVRYRKRHNKKIHRHKSKSVSLLNYIQWCPRLHLEKHSVQAVPSQKQKKKG